MMNFSKRSNQPELLDQSGIPFEDIQRNMYELSVINEKLGGHAITWKGFEQLANMNGENRVCEIGCGGGDNLKAIEKKAVRYPRLSFEGIDINPDCIRVAEQLQWAKPACFMASDYRQVHFSSLPDILFSSLFCHHFKDSELVEMFRWMKENSRSGFFINDLHRHPLAFYSIRLLTALFSKSRLVKNDAPLSVRRGFKKKELVDLLRQAGISNFSIQWWWAFRWLIVVHK